MSRIEDIKSAVPRILEKIVMYLPCVPGQKCNQILTADKVVIISRTVRRILPVDVTVADYPCI